MKLGARTGTFLHELFAMAPVTAQKGGGGGGERSSLLGTPVSQEVAHGVTGRVDEAAAVSPLLCIT